MSWSRGSGLFAEIIDALNDADVDDSQREKIYQHLIEAFEDLDCDTLDECVGEDPVFDKVFKEYSEPEEDEDSEDEWED